MTLQGTGTMNHRPRVHALYDAPLSGADIEAASLAHIDTHAVNSGFSAREWTIVRRLIHTTGDVALASQLSFSADAVDAGVAALQGHALIYVDASMARAGLSLGRLRKVSGAYCDQDILCHVADNDVSAQARKAGLPRSLFAIRKAAPRLNGAIVAIGNAPVALLELNRLILEEGVRPALVIGMPVGFIHVDECKEELMALDVPHIVTRGRRGGSACAVAALHAICQECGMPSGGETPDVARAWEPGSFAVLILGHGSRRPGAAKAMERIALTLRRTGHYAAVEAGFMAHAQPSFAEAFAACTGTGAKRVLVIPYFLHEGVHRAHDIPHMLKDLTQRYPDVSVVLGKTLGYDDVLVDLVRKRIEESKGGPEIRDMAVEPEEVASGHAKER